MRDFTEKRRRLAAGFTRTELLVLLGVGMVLSVALGADLTQTKSKLLQQACVANLKQWGMIFDLYSQDYNGTIYYDVGGAHWDDVGVPSNPYQPYMGGIGGGGAAATIREMRICPAVAARMEINQIANTSDHSYAMPIGTYHKGLTYVNADGNGPFFVNGSYWPNLKSCPNVSKYLLVIDGNGLTVHCGGLTSAISTTVPSQADQVPAINRHDGAVNCLFGDFHVELISAQAISNQDAISCTALPGNPWFTLN